ncbi:MAG: hypothetical protein LIO99_12555 [Clostridiales bacterium]|nr:hypothetical protein [Clostridiales bacterium]
MKRKLLSLVLAASMVMGMTSFASAEESTVSVDFEEYTATSTEIYDAALGEFYDAYMEALEAETVSERYALMAVAEAKILESAVMLPTTTQGGVLSDYKVCTGQFDFGTVGQ